MPAHKSPRPFVRCKNTHRKWPGCLVKFSQRSQSAREPSDFARPPSRGGNPVWGKALLGRQPSCRYFPPLWRKAHSALGGAIIAPAPPAIGRYAIYIKNQDKSNRCPLMQRVAPPQNHKGKARRPTDFQLESVAPVKDIFNLLNESTSRHRSAPGSVDSS